MKPDENNILKLRSPKYLNSKFVLKETDIEKEIKLYNFVDEKQYKFIKKGDLIKYFTSKGEYRAGGSVLENNYPEFITIQQISEGYKWPVYLNRGNIIYSKEIIDNKIIDKNTEIEVAMNIYKKIKNKEYTLLETKDYKKLIKNFKK